MPPRKRPARREDPTGRKRPAFSGEPLGELPEGTRIAWRFSRVDFDGEWGWSSLEPGALGVVHDKLCSFETMNESELFGRGGHKRIAVESVCSRAQARLVAIEQDDLDHLWELRLGGKPRVWGARQGHVFFPIWWDPEHTVCPSKKKGT